MLTLFLQSYEGSGLKPLISSDLSQIANIVGSYRIKWLYY